MNDMRKARVLAAVAGCLLASLAPAQVGTPTTAVIFENVRIFDGTRGQPSAPAHVLVTGNVIGRISMAPIADPANTRVQRVAGNGRTLMPGLIDNHWHALLARPTPAQAIEGDIGYTNLLAAAEAEATLMRGFTTVRDLGGPSFGLKRAILMLGSSAWWKKARSPTFCWSTVTQRSTSTWSPIRPGTSW